MNITQVTDVMLFIDSNYKISPCAQGTYDLEAKPTKIQMNWFIKM